MTIVPTPDGRSLDAGEAPLRRYLERGAEGLRTAARRASPPGWGPCCRRSTGWRALDPRLDELVSTL